METGFLDRLANQLGANKNFGAELATGNYVRVALILTAGVLVTVSLIGIARHTAPQANGPAILR